MNDTRARRIPVGLAAGSAKLRALLACAALAGGCADVGIAYKRWQAPALPGQGAAGGGVAPWPTQEWWRGWEDPQLDALVAKALSKAAHVKAVQDRLASFRVPPDRLWETQAFVHHRPALDAAIGRSRASQADAQAARLLLAGSVITAYVELGRVIAAQRFAQQLLEQREESLSLVRQRVDGGIDADEALIDAQAFAAQAATDLASMSEAVLRGRQALAQLTGQEPRTIEALEPRLLGVVAAPLPASISADLIGRRADLVALRWQVESLSPDLSAARARFYPNVNLLAFAGSPGGLERLLQPGSVALGAGPAVHVPIFQTPRLRANGAAREAALDAAVRAYDAALLRALREVAQQVSTLQSLESQQALQHRALQSAEAAFDAAAQRHRSGLDNFLAVLTAERSVLTQRRAVIDLTARRLIAEAALARALGGGFRGHGPAEPSTVRPGIWPKS